MQSENSPLICNSFSLFVSMHQIWFGDCSDATTLVFDPSAVLWEKKKDLSRLYTIRSCAFFPGSQSYGVGVPEWQPPTRGNCACASPPYELIVGRDGLYSVSRLYHLGSPGSSSQTLTLHLPLPLLHLWLCCCLVNSVLIQLVHTLAPHGQLDSVVSVRRWRGSWCGRT